MNASPPTARAAWARPAVSVIVPFLGGPREAEAAIASLRRLHHSPRDELIVVDNTPGGGIGRPPAGVCVVEAGDHRSSYYARNVGAEAAVSDWLLFLDADCIPAPGLLDAYFADPIGDELGAVAGEIEASDTDLLARYVVSRGLLNQARMLAHSYRPAAVTANLLVRRRAWERVGGFQEGIRSGGDSDFCWRLQDDGWALARRPGALVAHRHRKRLRAFARQLARHAAGAAWLNRRHPGSSPRPPLARGLARCLAGVTVWTVTGRFERARFKALDALTLVATSAGYLTGANAAPRPGPARGRFDAVILADSFPHLSETFVVGEVRAMRRLGYRVRVEALTRPPRPLRGGIRGLDVRYREDDALISRLTGFGWLALAHPLRCARDARSQRRWRRGGDHVTRLPSVALLARRVGKGGEHHLHAHFATAAALEAMRVSALLGVPYSVAPHAYEIFARPSNLREKLERARFVATDCDYNVRHLRELLAAGGADRIHEVVLGVDERRFRRSSPPPGGRTVGAIGRLVEKKGFSYLIEAIAELARRGSPVDQLRIAGHGPLRGELESLARRLGVEDQVLFLGPVEPDRVLELLSDIAVLAMPCVIAADGDRDSMPVVVKEALAMEVPVVASDLVGLPEVIRQAWGRLVPPRDPDALADALAELLALPLDRRAEMGARGRAHVLEHCNVDLEAAKVARLIGLDRHAGCVAEDELAGARTS